MHKTDKIILGILTTILLLFLIGNCRGYKIAVAQEPQYIGTYDSNGDQIYEKYRLYDGQLTLTTKYDHEIHKYVCDFQMYNGLPELRYGTHFTHHHFYSVEDKKISIYCYYKNTEYTLQSVHYGTFNDAFSVITLDGMILYKTSIDGLLPGAPIILKEK